MEFGKNVIQYSYSFKWFQYYEKEEVKIFSMQSFLYFGTSHEN